jgi:transposase
MPAKKYIVKLTDDERQTLLDLTSQGEVRARVMKRAQILLKADEGMKDADIVSVLNTSRPTVERIRKRFVEGNLERGLYDDPRPGSKTKLDGRGEAELIALTCSDAPDGHEKWSLRLLADKLVEMDVVDGISHETVRQALKKMI